MLKIIGYARVSTHDQNIDSQLDYLNRMGCQKIYQEKISATSKERHMLSLALSELSINDVLIVYKLDRLGRSVKELINIVDLIKNKGAHLKTSDGIDTSTSYGLFVFHIFSALAEMELALIKERTKVGLMAAKSRGRIGGRPRGLSQKSKEKLMLIESLYHNHLLSIDEICQQLEISRTTLYKYLKLEGIEIDRRKEN